jgi:transcriptional regulator with GAF, ATPase, and Fis domain
VNRPLPAKLVVIGGALTGEVFPLNADEVTLGRDGSNTIAIADGSLSRSHCAFSRDRDEWRLRDLGSSNGTFVNSVQVRSHLLTKGDRISAGNCMLLYVPLSGSPPTAKLTEDEPLPSTSRVALDKAAYLRKVHRSEAQPRNVEQGLRALLTISTAINAIGEEDELHRALLQLVMEIVPADRGAILLPGPGADLVIQAVLPSSIQNELRVSATTVRRATEGMCGIVCDGSLMAVPIAIHRRLLGVIYLATGTGKTFDEDHLQLTTAIARIAAIAVENVRRLSSLERETERLQSDLQLNHQMIGRSRNVQEVYSRIARVAKVDTTALITGETGTGKELCARAIHLNSARARRPFVAINCAALSESLLESELFGHERGAFTGAFSMKKGKLEIADGGTVLLDEIGELALPLQSKLLRVLQEREFDRVGGTHPIKVNLRILAATNRNLADDVTAGRFRQDLFYRLNVVAIELPPLRERRDDVPLLARHFAGLYGAKIGRPVTTISATAMNALVKYDWPGNVRELENAIERALVLGAAQEVLLEDLPETLIDAARIPHLEDGETLHAQVLETKRTAVINAHRKAGGNFTEAAKLLGVHPNYLHRLIRNLDIRPALERAEA